MLCGCVCALPLVSETDALGVMRSVLDETAKDLSCAASGQKRRVTATPAKKEDRADNTKVRTEVQDEPLTPPLASLIPGVL